MSIIDTRIDPVTLVAYPVERIEKRTVALVPGLRNKYGVCLAEAPKVPDQGIETIEVSYLDGDGDVVVRLDRADITNLSLSVRQFQVNFGDLRSDGRPRNFRIGQLFVNPALNGVELTIRYLGNGSLVNALNLAPPVGAPFTQYPGLKPPSELYFGTTWKKYAELYPQYEGVFFRLDGGKALPYDESGLAQPQGDSVNPAGLSVEVSNNTTLVGQRVIADATNWASGDEIIKVPLVSTVGATETRPRNATAILWVRLM